MKHLFAAAVLVGGSSALAAATSAETYVRQVTGISDIRLTPTSCNSSEGSSAFGNASSTATRYCIASIEGAKSEFALLVVDASKMSTAYRISACDDGRGASDGGQYLHREQICSVRAMNLETLEPSGRTSKLKLTTEADPSGVNLYFSFKLNQVAIKSSVAPIDDIYMDAKN